MDSRVGTDIVTFDVDPEAYRNWQVDFAGTISGTTKFNGAAASANGVV